MAEQQENQISIQDLELSLEVYELESEQKLVKLQALFKEKGVLDLTKMFYQDRSSLEIKFQNIVSDLTEFLINQEIASTEKLRRTFYRILENPLLLLFKVSRFEIFNLRLNAFDIELEPIEAIIQLSKAVLKNINEYVEMQKANTPKFNGQQYKSYEEFLQHSKINLIQDQIFLLYSYLRKGGNILRKKFEDKVKIVEIFNEIDEKLMGVLIKNKDAKTLKQLSVFNYEIYLLESSFDVMCFYLKVPFWDCFQQVFKELQILGAKGKQNSNYDLFILIFIRYNKQILKKIDEEGIDPVYAPYIENVLTAMLQIWGVRLCLYKEFVDLFQRLFAAHPNQIRALEICLKHAPDLKKDDIVLLRTNFKLELEKKHNQLLSILKSRTLEEINEGLTIQYHKKFYNLDFKGIEKEKILELLTSMNGNSAITEFFNVTERAFKEWNHTIDFAHVHKFIQGEFKYPSDQTKVLQSLRLFNNLCILEEKGFNKQYENLIKSKTITKALVGLITFSFTEETAKKFVKQNELYQQLVLNSLKFFKKCLTQGESDWQKISLILSKNINLFTEKNAETLFFEIQNIVQNNLQVFHINQCLQVFVNLLHYQQSHKKNQKKNINHFLELFMKGVKPNNAIIKKFRFFDSKVNQKLKITEQQGIFLKKYAKVTDNIISAKDNGCFKLTQLQIVTNPVQFEKVMDNYYFTLDNNSKKFIQFMAGKWIETQNTPECYLLTNILSELVEEYPISVPVLCSTRVSIDPKDESQTIRFAEALSVCLTNHSKQILSKIISCRSIRYRDGKDYVVEEIIPMILKQIIRKVNSQQCQPQNFQILAESIKHSKLSDIKLDLILKSIEKTNEEIAKCTNQVDLNKLSKCHTIMIKTFFRKKQHEMRKEGLVNIYKSLIWNEVRNNPAKVIEVSKAQSKNTVIAEQIMVSPYALNQDYNILVYTLEKINKETQIKAKQAQKLIEFQNILKDIEVKKQASTVVNGRKQEAKRIIDLSSLKLNIDYYFGEQNIQNICQKQNIEIKTNTIRKTKYEASNNEQNASLVQYYLKQMLNPSLNFAVIQKCLLGILKRDISLNHIFTNSNNLTLLFVSLILLLQYVQIEEKRTLPAAGDLNDNIIATVNHDRLQSQKLIFNVLKDIGYTNLWAQNIKSLTMPKEFDAFKSKIAFKVPDGQAESFFSIVLKIGLANQHLKEQLNGLLGSIFETRPKDQNSLMYNVLIDKGLLNSIMKSLQISNLHNVSLLFHSNFNNLRLYTDQLQQGLKALNVASKNRSYNEYIQLSKEIEDQEFFGPMKLFKQNFVFFIKIQKEGYNFKKNEEVKLALERFINLIRAQTNNETIIKQSTQIISDYLGQLQKLQISIANRVKSFYLVTKLRDLSYQNALTITLLQQILSEKKQSTAQNLQKIKKIEIFSLMCSIYNNLVQFDDSWQNLNKYKSYDKADRRTALNQVSICTTRRFSHSMSKIYEKCDLEFDQVTQRCVDVLKGFFNSEEGKLWLNTDLNLSPAFLTKSFINSTLGEKHSQSIKEILCSIEQANPVQIVVNDNSPISSIVKGLRQCDKRVFYQKNGITVKWANKSYNLADLLAPLKLKMIQSETLQSNKQKGHLNFNKYKTAEGTLQEIEILGYILGYSFIHGCTIDLPFHSSIVSAIGFGICDIDDLLDIDFKIWENIKNVMSAQDSKDLNLNFSYIFESLTTFKPERIELIDKGSSKKVNNLNRDEYGDLVTCYLLFGVISKQIERFLQAIIYVCPKEYLACLPLFKILGTFYAKNPQYSNEIMQKQMKKIGIIYPSTAVYKEKRIQNLKDYQNIQWLIQILFENEKLREKIWKNETVISIVTSTGAKGSIDITSGTIFIEHFSSKQDLKKQLQRIVK